MQRFFGKTIPDINEDVRIRITSVKDDDTLECVLVEYNDMDGVVAINTANRRGTLAYNKLKVNDITVVTCTDNDVEKGPIILSYSTNRNAPKYNDRNRNYTSLIKCFYNIASKKANSEIRNVQEMMQNESMRETVDRMLEEAVYPETSNMVGIDHFSEVLTEPHNLHIIAKSWTFHDEHVDNCMMKYFPLRKVGMKIEMMDMYSIRCDGALHIREFLDAFEREMNGYLGVYNGGNTYKLALTNVRTAPNWSYIYRIEGNYIGDIVADVNALVSRVIAGDSEICCSGVRVEME